MTDTENEKLLEIVVMIMSSLEWMTALYGEPTSDDDEMTENVENRDFGPQIRQLFLTEGREHDAVFYSKRSVLSYHSCQRLL